MPVPPIRRLLTTHWTLTLLIMMAAALTFGLSTLNLYALVQANIGLIARHGTMALLDGGLLQTLELLAYGLVGVLAYVVVKACERVLVERLLG
ncbi:hypothetical protein [Rhodoplanes azumiensis]|uniref:Uncharacterized protein n=1 Tax=Rhodoplanes azumiensis TaxID=1897628 RepID=A0ABW5AMW3_9BRAD